LFAVYHLIGFTPVKTSSIDAYKDKHSRICLVELANKFIDSRDKNTSFFSTMSSIEYGSIDDKVVPFIYTLVYIQWRRNACK
jgi:hypothetical protein